MEKVLKPCQPKAEKLLLLFERVVPTDGPSRMTHYRDAARTIGEGGRVEDLFTSILDDLQRLVLFLGFSDSTTRELINSLKCGEQVKETYKYHPSLPDTDLANVNAERGTRYKDTGSGNLNNRKKPGKGHNIYHGTSPK